MQFDCCVCLDSLLCPLKSCSTSCGHLYHVECLNRWSTEAASTVNYEDQRVKCAVCRSPIEATHNLILYHNSHRGGLYNRLYKRAQLSSEGWNEATLPQEMLTIKEDVRFLGEMERSLKAELSEAKASNDRLMIELVKGVRALIQQNVSLKRVKDRVQSRDASQEDEPHSSGSTVKEVNLGSFTVATQGPDFAQPIATAESSITRFKSEVVCYLYSCGHASAAKTDHCQVCEDSPLLRQIYPIYSEEQKDMMDLSLLVRNEPIVWNGGALTSTLQEEIWQYAKNVNSFNRKLKVILELESDIKLAADQELKLLGDIEKTRVQCEDVQKETRALLKRDSNGKGKK